MPKRKVIQIVKFKIARKLISDQLTPVEGSYKNEYYEFIMEIYADTVNHFGHNGHLYESGSNLFVSAVTSESKKAKRKTK